MRAAVVGAGSWGTALAQLLAGNGNDVALWARKDEVAAAVNERHRNPRYLSDVQLNDAIAATTSLEAALDGAGVVVVATPSTQARPIAAAIKPHIGDDAIVVICSKGVEEGTGKLCDEVFAEELGRTSRITVLSGPNHAEEVVVGIPAASVIASRDIEAARKVQELVSSPTFRAYTSTDIVGVELCAAFKNVIAIAVGAAYGIGFGDNTASALITRGMAEMGRLVSACGGNPLTCMGLAGTGDLIATCMSRHSRNRRLGQMIAAGKTLDDFTAETHMVAEGAYACKTLAALSARYGVELPVTDIVRDVVWNGRDAREASNELFNRPLKDELYGIR